MSLEQGSEHRIVRWWDGRPWTGAAYQIRLHQLDSLIIEIDAPYHGDPPPPGEPGPTDRLWEYEVVELFVADEGDRYTEIELGPHGHHLVLQLDGIRQPVSTHHPLRYAATVDGDRWHGRAEVPRALLPGLVRFNLYAIHSKPRVHLALFPVPGESPDFHQLDRFRPWPFSAVEVVE